MTAAAGALGTALVLAPQGRDAAILAALAAEAGLGAEACASLDALAARLGDATRVVVMTEEAARGSDLAALAAHVEAQPPWSDLPFVVLTRRGGGAERDPGLRRLQTVLGNVSFVERPFHPTTLTSVLRAADRGRSRQYEARARLVALEEGEGRLRRLAETLEERVEARTAELRQRTAERDRIWRASRDLYVVIDRDGHFRETNPAWGAALGHAASDLMGVRFDALVHPEDRLATEARWLEILGGATVNGFEIRVRDAAGGHRWHEWTAFADGDVVVAFGRDVEERRARDAALRDAEEALRQSQKLEMIGQLTGGVAHDFNNLLMAVQASIEAARRRLPPGEARLDELLGNALSGVARGAALTQRMLAFARRQDLAPGPVDVAALVEGMRDLLVRSLGREIEVATAFTPDAPPALVDANQLEMALLNLAVNARDAMEEGGRLRIEVDADPDAGTVRVRVVDDGAGMDAATLGRAREPFFTTKGVGKGTGLGLSMVHGLAEQSGGAFHLTSAPGRGTTAEIVLPAAEGLAPAPAAVAPDGAGVPAAEDRPLRILAVDDDALVLMGTEAMIEDLGHEVLSASSGAEALTILARHDVDVVLTDQAMPRMTGLELARAIRRDRPGIPVVLATGYSDQPEGAAGLFAAQIAKPFLTGHLRDALRAARHRGDG